MRLLLAAATIGALSSGLAPSAVSAQTIPSNFEFIEKRQHAGAFVGYSFLNSGRFGFGPSGGLHVGGRYGVNLSGPLALEAHAGVISGERDIINPARPLGDRVVGTGDVLLGTLDGRLRLTLTGDRTWHGMAPFIVFGGGIAFDLAAEQAVDELLETQDRFEFGTSFLGTAGGGTSVFVSERLELRGDGVFSLWKLGTPPGFSDPERGFLSVEESEWVGGFHATLTFFYRF